MQAHARDTVDNVATSAAVHVTVTGGTGGGGGGTPVTTVFGNGQANDGDVKASSGGSAPAVGTLEAYQGLAIGRGTDGKFNRTLLSFDTSAIPDGATVTNATVTVQYRSASGNPWTNPAGNALLVDVQRGCLGAGTIEAADWGAAVTAGGVAQVPAFTGGSQASTTFNAAGVAAINVAGCTQLRLRFGQEQTSSNYVLGGDGATATLLVTYVP